MAQQNKSSRWLLCLSVIGFVGLVVTLIFYLVFYNAPPPTPTPTTSPTPTPTTSPTPTVTLTPTLLPPPTLEDPKDGSCLDCGSEVTFRWSHTHTLQDEECYQLKVQEAKEQEPTCYYPGEASFSLPTPPSPGEYSWRVSVVQDQDNHVLVSEESALYTFTINPPPPEVHSISPTTIVQGTSVQLVVSGEDLTLSLTITIDSVALQTTLVDSRTITATVPMTITQEVGQHTVIVSGEEWPDSLIVVKPTPTPPPPPTPIPPQPPITPLGPKDNHPVGNKAEFTWEWDGSLADLGPNAVFTIRWGLASEGEPHSQVWCTVVERPGENYCPDKKWLVDFQDCDHTGERTIAWNVAVALVDWDARTYRQVLVESDIAYFRVQTRMNDCPP